MVSGKRALYKPFVICYFKVVIFKGLSVNTKLYKSALKLSPGMVKRIGTSQRKTRHKFTKHHRQRGKMSVNHYLQQLNSGDTVNLIIDSAVQHGRFFSRFHGMTGTVTGQRGFCYEVRINDHGKEKTVYVHPIHLKKNG